MAALCRYVSLLVVVTALAGSSASRGNAGKVISRILKAGKVFSRIDTLQTCPNNPMENCKLDNITRVQYGAHEYFIDGIFYLYRDVTGSKMTITFNRCRNTAQSSCEDYQHWGFKENSCLVALQEDMPWAGIFHRFTPAMQCPMKKGEYILRNGTVLLEYVKHLPLPLENFYWRFIIQVFEGDALFCCTELHAAFYRSRN